MQAQLKRTGIDVQQMIQDRVTKVEEIKLSLELNKVSFPKHEWKLHIPFGFQHLCFDCSVQC